MLNHCPKISCVMVAKDEPIDSAIRCYQNQTYPNRELIVISSHQQNLKGDIWPGNILVFECPDLPYSTMRNIGTEIAAGEIICQWEAGDLSHPFRLTEQHKALMSVASSEASIYSEWLHLSGDVVRWCKKQLLCSVMFKKIAFYRHQSLLYSDEYSLDRFFGVCPVASFNYVSLGKCEEAQNLDLILENRSRLESTFLNFGFKEITVCDSDNVVFVYRRENEI